MQNIILLMISMKETCPRVHFRGCGQHIQKIKNDR